MGVSKNSSSENYLENSDGYLYETETIDVLHVMNGGDSFKNRLRGN